MRRKISLLVAVALFLTTMAAFVMVGPKGAEAAPAIQKVSIANATVTADKVNVRQGPATSYPVVCTLTKGQTVMILGKLGNWYAVYETKMGCVGAVDGRFLKIAGTTAVPSKKATPAKKATPKTTTPKATGKPAPAAKPPAVTTGDVSAEEQQMLDLVNKARADAGLGPLAFDKELQKVARLKAKDMVDNNYFSHQSPTYGSPFDMMRQFGITFKTAGENIAGNQTVKGAFDAWMASEGHRANILNGKFNYTGIGIVAGSKYGYIFVQQFIGR